MAQPSDLYLQAVDASNRGDRDRAIALLSQIPPESGALYAKAHDLMGRMLWKAGDLEKAEQYLRSAARQVADPDLSFQLAEFYFAQKKWNEAESALRRTINLDPKYTDAYIRVGMIQRERGELTQATRSFEMAIVNDQKAVVARYYLALLCLQTGDQKRALSQLHFVLKIQPDYQPARLLMGDVYQRLGDHRQALVEYCEVANAESTDATLYWRMGRSFQAIKDRDQALKAFERAYYLDRTLHAAGHFAAQWREELGHWERSHLLYQELRKSDEFREIAEEAIARLGAILGQFDLGGAKAQRKSEDFDSPPPDFEAPPVQTRSTTEPFEMGAVIGTQDLGSPRAKSARRPASTSPISLIEDVPEPTVLEGFLRGVLDSVRRHLPEDALRMGRDAIDGLKKLDIETIKGKLDIDALRPKRDSARRRDR